MNKAELINVITENVDGVTKKQAEEMLDVFVNTVIKTLTNDGQVTIAGFGQFLSKIRAGRTGVNPQNPSEPIQIPAVKVPKFKAGKRLKDALKKKDDAVNNETDTSESNVVESTPLADDTSVENNTDNQAF